MVNSTAFPSRAFGSSVNVQGKKGKKQQAKASTIEDKDFDLEQEVLEDDLFGETTSFESVSSSPPASKALIKDPLFSQKAEDFRKLLDLNVLNQGKNPAQGRWRNLVLSAGSREELEECIGLAETFKSRVGSLVAKSSDAFANRACFLGYPELALNTFLDRYRFGLDVTPLSLHLIQTHLAMKLASPDEQVILASQQLPGSPVPATDLFQDSSAINATEGGENQAEEGEKGSPGTEVKQFSEEEKRILVARLSIIDRMSLASNLAPTVSGLHDTYLLSFVCRSMIKTFGLDAKESRAVQLPAGIKARVQQLVDHLAVGADWQTEEIRSAKRKASDASSSPTHSQRQERSKPALSLGSSPDLSALKIAKLCTNLTNVLRYVAIHLGEQRGKVGAGSPLEKVGKDHLRIFYSYLDLIAPYQKTAAVVEKTEMLLKELASESKA
ncbi:hypothetical protein IE53DRAFT_362402 [Violaceomyces palustris]|uniref:Uncharacterized protein n=1 Tax=Violaceomyces palustris TaxID=1673888 RepID=A0ACD0NXB6_9BASI|nr:hypothetical protein IE53DRAFT_362402 [Violaceomyces palustris]